MPRGKFTNHKGRNRRFTNPEELEAERRKEEQNSKWRKQHGIESSDESEDDEAAGDKKISEESGSGSSDDETSSDDESTSKAKGVSNLIEIENPNRVQKKSKKLTTLNTTTELAAPEKPQLSRREREEIEKQRAAAHYQKLHAKGKTEQARADLARLAIIKQQREEAARRREQEKEEKEKAAQQKTAQTQKALGKK